MNLGITSGQKAQTLRGDNPGQGTNPPHHLLKDTFSNTGFFETLEDNDLVLLIASTSRKEGRLTHLPVINHFLSSLAFG